MDVKTHHRQWKVEWYTTWHTRRHDPNNQSQKEKEKVKRLVKQSRRSRKYVEDEVEETGIANLESPEIGKIYTLRYRGEKASLVHLDFVSYLSKSRWKKKYFPKGIFADD